MFTIHSILCVCVCGGGGGGGSDDFPVSVTARAVHGLMTSAAACPLLCPQPSRHVLYCSSEGGGGGGGGY